MDEGMPFDTGRISLQIGATRLTERTQIYTLGGGVKIMLFGLLPANHPQFCLF